MLKALYLSHHWPVLFTREEDAPSPLPACVCAVVGGASRETHTHYTVPIHTLYAAHIRRIDRGNLTSYRRAPIYTVADRRRNTPQPNAAPTRK